MGRIGDGAVLVLGRQTALSVHERLLSAHLVAAEDLAVQVSTHVHQQRHELVDITEGVIKRRRSDSKDTRLPHVTLRVRVSGVSTAILRISHVSHQDAGMMGKRKKIA